MDSPASGRERSEGGSGDSTEVERVTAETESEGTEGIQSPTETQNSESSNRDVPSRDPQNETSNDAHNPTTENQDLKVVLNVEDLNAENQDSAEVKSDVAKNDSSESNNGQATFDVSANDDDDDDDDDSVLPSMGILPDADDETTNPNVISKGDAEVQTTTTAAASTSTDPSNVVHKIKKIKWQDIEVPIITQNNNGPCPLIAIVNVMILKGQITLPMDRAEITGGELVLVVGNALFDQPRNSLPSDMRRHVEQNTEDAISILHKLLTGLDVNVKFSGVRDFEFTGELCVFDLLGIMLYHGWVVDPLSEAAAIINNLSYNQLTNNIFAWREEAVKNNNNSLLVKAMLCEEFMANSGSQLTIHGLFELGSALRREEIAVLFRNNHFSTIYKRGDQLYQLLTDQGFLHENIVWETLNDVDATFSEFVNGNFETIPPAQDPAASSSDLQNMTLQQQINSDQQLAAMLQKEVDEQQRQQQNFERLKDSLGLHNLSDEEMAKKLQEEENRLAAEAETDPQPPRQANTTNTAAATTTTTSTGAVPMSVSSPIPHPSHTHEDKKKKECVIL